ncbi:hypothetical protein PoB_005045000 [Plakobranchus ocellatus]|uniref:Uncharacterized protein n=1 Tax=Plakobranchus ocellatus TaxID=259542 RepID=A0AAV4BX82_9GAST|nr:hypothetical protein PoB_005045000 [Plakobranchus ocellatus]
MNPPATPSTPVASDVPSTTFTTSSLSSPSTPTALQPPLKDSTHHVPPSLSPSTSNPPISSDKTFPSNPLVKSPKPPTIVDKTSPLSSSLPSDPAATTTAQISGAQRGVTLPSCHPSLLLREAGRQGREAEDTSIATRPKAAGDIAYGKRTASPVVPTPPRDSSIGEW